MKFYILRGEEQVEEEQIDFNQGSVGVKTKSICYTLFEERKRYPKIGTNIWYWNSYFLYRPLIQNDGAGVTPFFAVFNSTEK